MWAAYHEASKYIQLYSVTFFLIFAVYIQYALTNHFNVVFCLRQCRLVDCLHRYRLGL